MLAHTEIVDRQHQPARLGRVPESKPESLNSITDRMLAAANGDLDAATEAMAAYLEGLRNPTHRAHVLRLGCRKLITDNVRTERRGFEMEISGKESGKPFSSAPHRLNEAARATQESFKRLGETYRAALLDMPLIIGGQRRRLRDITGTEAASYGEVELSKGLTAVRNARFYIAIGKEAGAALIGATVSEEKAVELHQAALSNPA